MSPELSVANPDGVRWEAQKRRPRWQSHTCRSSRSWTATRHQLRQCCRETEPHHRSRRTHCSYSRVRSRRRRLPDPRRLGDPRAGRTLHWRAAPTKPRRDHGRPPGSGKPHPARPRDLVRASRHDELIRGASRPNPSRGPASGNVPRVRASLFAEMFGFEDSDYEPLSRFRLLWRWTSASHAELAPEFSTRSSRSALRKRPSSMSSRCVLVVPARGSIPSLLTTCCGTTHGVRTRAS